MATFLIESMTISFWTKGGYNFESLQKLPFDDFEIVLREALRVQKLNKNGGTDG